MAHDCPEPATCIAVLSFGTYFWCDLHRLDIGSLGKDKAAGERDRYILEVIDGMRKTSPHA